MVDDDVSEVFAAGVSLVLVSFESLLSFPELPFDSPLSFVSFVSFAFLCVLCLRGVLVFLRVVSDVPAGAFEMKRGRRHQLVDRLAAGRACLEWRIRELQNLLEVMARFALVFVQGHYSWSFVVGPGASIEQVALVAEHQLAMQPEGRGALGEQRVVE